MNNLIDINLQEIKQHGTHEFPFVIYNEEFDTNNLSYISCHWHNEIEIIYCYEGSISYTVNNKNFILNKGNAIMVNSNIIHQNDMIDKSNWYAILFDPKLIYGADDSILKQVFDNIKYDSIYTESSRHIELIQKLIYDYFLPKSILHDLKVKRDLLNVYTEILNDAYHNGDIKAFRPTSEMIKVKAILDYIYANYKNKISIDDISRAVGSCRSEVCRIFKDALNTSIADYILKLKLEKSITLLMSDNLTITEIAEQSGFNSSSYYAEAFKKVIKMTPREYKRKNQKDGNTYE